MTIFNCTFVSVETRNIPAFLSEYIHSITICTNGLLFSSYATASKEPKKENISDKAFEPLFFDFADRADFRWVFAGTEIPADRTTPDREWQRG